MPDVRFNLRPTAKKGHSIQFIYRLNGDNKKVAFSTKLFTKPTHWNKAKMRLRSTAPNNLATNAILDKFELHAKEVIQEAILNQEYHSTTSFKEEVLRKVKGEQSTVESNEVLKYYSSYMLLKKPNIAQDTLNQYASTLSHLSLFIKSKKNNAKIEFKDCNEQFFKAFIAYLRDDKGLADNTINKILKHVQSVFNHATEKGVNLLKDYKADSCQVSYIEQPQFYLNEEEIQSIRDVELKKSDKLYKTRSQFLVGYNSGQRYSDFSEFKKEHIVKTNSKRYIHKRMQKTGEYVKIPINTELNEIIEEYKGFPKFISAQKFNDNLKELCKLAGIDTKVARNESGKQVMKPKHELVASHICRRSLATNMYKMQPDLYSIMKITGHTTIQQLQTYICIDENEVAEIAAQHPFFK